MEFAGLAAGGKIIPAVVPNDKRPTEPRTAGEGRCRPSGSSDFDVGSSVEAAIGKESDAKLDLDRKQNVAPPESQQANTSRAKRSVRY